MSFSNNQKLIGGDEKMFIIGLIDNFFYRVIGVDSRPKFFGNNFEFYEKAMSISVSSSKRDIDSLFIRFGTLWNSENKKEIVIEQMDFRKELCHLDVSIKLLLILCEIAEKFSYQTIRFVNPSKVLVGEYICFKFDFLANNEIDPKKLKSRLKKYRSGMA
ncbi:hypothetical protein [Acinetobacter sp. YH12219]|uniref:hypothetical protein n=1 Tax=Acinetobacter sp. YH12219 TaxID=2601153 RepID=UPI0015D121E1|nr:hypothetical protein [Acinetobacter sp. YH12219]